MTDAPVTLLHDGTEAFPAMLSAIHSAKQEILLEMYWFASDRTGHRFATALIDRALNGVAVHLIYDAVGSIQTDEGLFDSLRTSGVRVHEYNPIAPWRARFAFAHLNHRDHRKLLVVDGAIAFTGGINLCDASAPREEGGEGWRDDTLCVTGPAATLLREVFVRNWQRCDPQHPVTWNPPPQPSTPLPVEVLTNDYRTSRQAITNRYLSELARAQKTVYITNAYFVPDRRVRRALVGAVKRGVDVRVLVPQSSDVLAVQYASQRLFATLLRRGVRIFRLRAPMLHAKTAVIDGQWCTVGSYNLDQRSWRSNLELNLATHNPALAAAMHVQFHADLMHAEALALATWRTRPWLQRLLEITAYSIRKFL